MFTGAMTKKNEYQIKNSKGAFDNAACPKPDEYSEFVKMLARIAAEKDYETLLKKSNLAYNGTKEKGPNL